MATGRAFEIVTFDCYGTLVDWEAGISGAPFHDVRPALQLKIPVAWINRKGEPLPPGSSPPDRELKGLDPLARWLAPSPGPETP